MKIKLKTCPGISNMSISSSHKNSQKSKQNPSISPRDLSSLCLGEQWQGSEAATYHQLSPPNTSVTTLSECHILQPFHLQSKSDTQSSFGSWTNVWENDYEEATSKRASFLSAFILGFLWPDLQATFINVIRTSLCLTQTRLWLWLKNMTDQTSFHTCSPPPSLFWGWGKF